MQLNEIQRRFKETMLSAPQALENLPGEMAALFEAGDIPLNERLKVYRNNIVGTIGDTMTGSFPILEKLVGRDFLKRMARSFILAHPPTEGCLNDYGAGFDQFIAGFEPAKDLPYLPDVARLETAINRAYHAKDDKPLRAAELAVIPENELADFRLGLRDCVQLVSSQYPLNKIREFSLGDSDGTLDINRGGVKLMVYRPALEVKIDALGEDEFAMLEQLKSGKTLGEALVGTLRDHPGFDIQKFLQRHLALEVFHA